MSKDKAKPATRSEVIIETWKKLNSKSLGASELQEIQNALAATIGERGVESPASIARTLADTGVTLRYSEVLDFDSSWRDAQSFDSMGCAELDFNSIDASVASINALRNLWDGLEEQQNTRGLATLREMVSAIRHQLQLLSRSPVVSEQRKKVAIEAELWLGIWQQNPRIFEDWRELRMHSDEFQRSFGQ